MNEMIRNEVIRRWRGGATMRAIARALGVSRNTVSRIVGQVDQTRAGQEPETPARRASLLDPYESIIQDLLGRYPDLTVVRLLEELRGRGFTGNYTIVRRRLQALRPRTPQQPVQRFETGPGAQAQMDYATYDLEFSEVGRRTRHAEEIPHLIPLPAAPYEVATMLYRSVTVEGCVAIQQNHYSVPWRYLGQLLPVRVTEVEVIIYDPQLEEVARHRLLPRSARNQRSEQAQHRPVVDQRQRQADLQERFDQLGTVAGRFLEGLMQAQRYGRDQAERVLALLGTYRRAD